MNYPTDIYDREINVDDIVVISSMSDREVKMVIGEVIEIEMVERIIKLKVLKENSPSKYNRKMIRKYHYQFTRKEDRKKNSIIILKDAKSRIIDEVLNGESDELD